MLKSEEEAGIPRNSGGDEELRAIGILTSVGHAKLSLLGMLQLEVLVGELLSIDGLAASTITFCEISTLNHELLDDTMKSRPFVPKAFFSSSQRSKVLRGLCTNTSAVPLIVSCGRQSMYFGYSLAV